MPGCLDIELALVPSNASSNAHVALKNSQADNPRRVLLCYQANL